MPRPEIREFKDLLETRVRWDQQALKVLQELRESRERLVLRGLKVSPERQELLDLRDQLERRVQLALQVLQDLRDHKGIPDQRALQALRAQLGLPDRE